MSAGVLRTDSSIANALNARQYPGEYLYPPGYSFAIMFNQHPTWPSFSLADLHAFRRAPRRPELCTSGSLIYPYPHVICLSLRQASDHFGNCVDKPATLAVLCPLAKEMSE